jgi:hypothetical protein
MDDRSDWDRVNDYLSWGCIGEPLALVVVAAVVVVQQLVRLARAVVSRFV